MSKVLIIGAGGVEIGVVVHKCTQAKDVFTHITLANRTLSKCEKIKRSERLRGVNRDIAQVDADNVPQTTELLNTLKPDLVINVALPCKIFR